MRRIVSLPRTGPFCSLLSRNACMPTRRSFAMSSQQLAAEFLLQQIPEVARAQTVRKCIQSLVRDRSIDGASLAASLLVDYPDPEAKSQFVGHLVEILRDEHVTEVEALCKRFPELATELLRAVIERLYGSVDQLPHLNGVSELARPADQNHDPQSPATASLVRFAENAKFYEVDQESLSKLFTTLISLLGDGRGPTRMAARNVLVSVFTHPSTSRKVDDSLVWQRIMELAITEDKSLSSTAYSLWLRWAASKPASLAAWFGETYWDLLLRGLRRGDAETRKQCLGILRQSVAMAAQDVALRSQICSYQSDSTPFETVQAQYDRFLTVFETIVLGRYINQVTECQDDLQLLASKDSIVQSKWFCCLLAASLDPNIQESNRKFIGNWIMKSRYQPQNSGLLLSFFQDDLIPWFVQGTLFTSSLREFKGQPRCAHGERLATYVSDLLKQNSHNLKLVSNLIDVVLSALTGTKSVRFAHAIVYLIHGLCLGLESVTDFKLNHAQVERLSILSASTNLPEVARDFVLVRCLKMVAEKGSGSADPEAPQSIKEQWDQVRAMALDEKITNAPLTSKHASLSRREQYENAIEERIRQLSISTESKTRGDEPALQKSLTDLWNDIEFAEYPKRPLLDFAGFLVQPAIFQQAKSDEAFSTLVAKLLNGLLDMCATRIYLFAPLSVGIASNIIADPSVGKIIRPSDFVLKFCEGLPEPSIDMKLEEATAALLASTVSDEFQRFGYSYYFGDKASLGVAAILDFVSRLGSVDAAALNETFKHIRMRWLAQKNPPPTVSPWKSALQLQVMLLCCEQIIPSASVEDATKILQDLHYLLSIEPLPRYRYLLSWMISRAYLQHDDLQSGILAEMATKDHHSNPKYLASLMKIGVMLAKVPDATETFASKLASACIPLAASSKVVIRHEAQWQIPILLDHARDKGWKSVAENPGLLALDEYIRTLERFDDPPLERILDRFDPISEHNLTNLAEGRWWALDDIETPSCNHNDLTKAQKSLTPTSQPLHPPCIPLGNAIPTLPTTDPSPPSENAIQPPSQTLLPSKSTDTRALQTKGTAYLLPSTSPSSSSSSAPRRRPIIVIASLVDNPHNLGGLSRAAEIFGASELHLQNQNVTSTRDFQNVSVSSHLHFPICQLSAGAAMMGFVAEKKKEGYVVVGIEQTDRSLVLGGAGVVLPERMVLVMGSEKEGIPALVLGECDLLVEIPQRGVTRSLNVQTAVACVLFEYARQYPGKDVSG